MATWKRSRFWQKSNEDLFADLPDDLVVLILRKVGESASCPSDFFSAVVTCKRFHSLGIQPVILARVGREVMAVTAETWSRSAHRFLVNCVRAGNVEACYILGMIHFYCLENRGGGASLMARAAMKCHAAALYSLAIIQFNGTGGTTRNKDLRAGFALCARAAFLGHVGALREVGHCLHDGYGVKQNVAEGRRLLIQADVQELARSPVSGTVHPANRFLISWFYSKNVQPRMSLRLCSHEGCGRRETRSHEFRRCSVCCLALYCSRGCQALDWKLSHKTECDPIERWLGAGALGIVMEADAADEELDKAAMLAEAADGGD